MLAEKTIVGLESLYAKAESQYNEKARHYVQEQLQQNILLVQDMLAAVESGCGEAYPAVLQDYLAKIKSDYVEMRHLLEELDRKFMLFIMGSGKNGKSTLINALVGQTVAKEGIVPTTWKIDVFTEAAGEEVRFKFRDGSEQCLSKEAAADFLAAEDAKQKQSAQAVREEMRKFRASGASIRALEQKQASLNKYKLYRSRITEAVWPVQNSAILKNYRLVDTPGLRQELDDMIISNAREYYTKADGVIWVLPADKISGAGDRSEIDALLQDYGKRTDNLIVVINHIDKAIANGQTEAGILQEARRLYGDVSQEIILCSAKQAREAQGLLAGAEPGSPEERAGLELLHKSHLPDLQEHLNRTLFADAQRIQIESKVRSGSILFQDIVSLAGKAADLLQSVHVEERKKKERWEQESEALAAALTEELKSFSEREVACIYQAVSQEENQLWEMDGDSRNAYIMGKFVCPQRIESDLRALVDRQSQRLVELKAYHMQTAPFSEYPDLQQAENRQFMAEQELLGDTGIHGDLTDQGGAQMMMGGALAFGAAALLGPVGLVFAGIAVTDLGKSVAKWLSRTFGSSIATKVQERIAGQLSETNRKVGAEYKEFLGEAGLKIAALREDTYAELYGPSDRSGMFIVELEKMERTAYLVEPLSIEAVIFGE